MSLSKIYLNNFRGFYNSEIPVNDVNFLVGENSSGKTSILKLVELLSSQEFWLNGAFRDTHIDFGFFGDIYTETKKANDVTSIGVVFDHIDKVGQTSVLFIVDQNDDHQTRISGLKFNVNNEDFHVSFGEKHDISYKSVNAKNVTSKSFSKWCKDGIDSDNLISLTKDDDIYYMREAPYFCISQIYSKSTKKDKSKRSGDVLPFEEVLNGYKWIAPIRMKPQKTYDENVYDYSSDGAHVPYLLKKIFGSSRSTKSKKIINSLNKFGKESNLFDNISVKDFGTEGNSPFAIELVLSEKGRQITNVGYGVSQILPIAIEILNNGHGRFAIQQPEVHLHPRAQASFGGLIFDAATTNSKFLIETHSDFIVDRFRQQVSLKGLNKSSQVLFFERRKDKNIVYSVPILEDGQYSDKQPKSFREFFYNEALKNLGI